MNELRGDSSPLLLSVFPHGLPTLYTNRLSHLTGLIKQISYPKNDDHIEGKLK